MVDLFLILIVFGVFIGILVYKNKKYKQKQEVQTDGLLPDHKKSVPIHQIRQREMRGIPDLQTLKTL